MEYVPEGAEFTLAITGHNATPRQRSLLLYVLENAFRSDGRPARLGSQAANGWGKVSWSRTGLEALDVKAWMAAPPLEWHKALKTIEPAEQAEWLGGMEEFHGNWEGRRIRLRLTLEFDGAMLVNDPTRRKKAGQNGEGAVGHAMIRTEQGTAYLPARSVRGAFRAQARRIWQTLAWESPEQNVSVTRNTNAPRDGDQKRLAAFYKAFGSTGWRAPIEFQDFKLTEPEETHPQEFVAVDRFTGGAANEKKFNARGLWRPRFSGTVTIRADRWVNAKVGPWAWLLLAFPLRDWTEGDSMIGFGGSKGYGAFRARCEVLSAGPEADLLRGVLGAQRRYSRLGRSRRMGQVVGIDCPRPGGRLMARFYNPYHFVPVEKPGPAQQDLTCRAGCFAAALPPGSGNTSLTSAMCRGNTRGGWWCD